LKRKISAKTVSSFCFISLMVALLLLTACSSREGKKAKHLEQAREYIAKNELKKAVIELKNAVQLDPGDEGAYVELGETLLKLRESREAFRAFSTAVELNPENMKAQLKVGQMLLLAGRTEEARTKAELIIEKSPNHIDGLSLLSGVQIQEKNVDGAVETLEKAASIDPNHFGTRLSLGRLFLLKEQREKAEASYLKAISIDPSSTVPYFELSRIHVSRGDWDKAEEVLKRMLEAAGFTYQNLNVLASFYESADKLDLAEKTYIRAVETAPKEDVTPLMNLSAYYGRTKSYEKALEVLKRALDIKKNDPDIQASIAQLHFDFNELKSAEATVDKVLEKEKENVAAGLLKGKLLLGRNEYGAAKDKFDLVVRKAPSNAGAYYLRALCHRGSGEAKLAQQDLLKALELNPEMVAARLVLAEYHLREGALDLARRQIDESLRREPQNATALMLQGGLKQMERDFKAAENAYLKVIEISPGQAHAYVQLGLIRNQAGRQEEALAFFNKALELDPGQREALTLVVAHHVRAKNFDSAIRVCESHKKMVGDSRAKLALIEYLQGDIFLSKKDTSTAQEHFKKAIETDPDLAAPYLALARIFVQEKRYDQAIAEYESVLTRNPNYLAGHMAIGTIHDMKGDGAKAETYYRKALQIKKDFGPAANNLAWNLATRGGNIDEALTYAKIAKKEMPEAAAVMHTLGWIYYLKGNYPSAIAEFQGSLARDPDNALVSYHMGLAQHGNGDGRKAKEFLEKALKLDPTFQGADHARKVLDEIRGSGEKTPQNPIVR